MKLLQQIAFTFALARQIMRAKARCKFMIRFRIPYFVINAVGDADQPVSALLRKPFETISVFCGLDLKTIAARNGGQRIGNLKTRFHSRSISIKGKCISCKLTSESEFPQFAAIKSTLIRHIVDRENSAGVAPIVIPSTGF